MLQWIKSFNVVHTLVNNWSTRRRPEHAAPADLFDDRSMTFGEHIEELRKHLWRAIYGIIFFFLASFFFADYVVMLLTSPVEKQLREWGERNYQERARLFELTHAEEFVDWPARISGDQLKALAKAITGKEPTATIPDHFEMNVQVSVGKMIHEITMPLAEVYHRFNLKSYSAQEALMIYFKAMFGASIVLSSPWVFYQLYSFIAVGLYSHERRIVNFALPFSVFLFLSGVAMCFFGVLPFMLQFLFSANEWMNVEPEVRLSEWIGFAVILMLLFGATFQLPMLMLTLGRVGILRYDQLQDKRRHAILINFIAAAIITPGGDPYSLVLLAVPMCVLFEVGLQLMRYFENRRQLEDSLDPAEPVW